LLNAVRIFKCVKAVYVACGWVVAISESFFISPTQEDTFIAIQKLISAHSVAKVTLVNISNYHTSPLKQSLVPTKILWFYDKSCPDCNLEKNQNWVPNKLNDPTNSGDSASSLQLASAAYHICETSTLANRWIRGTIPGHALALPKDPPGLCLLEKEGSHRQYKVWSLHIIHIVICVYVLYVLVPSLVCMLLHANLLWEFTCICM